MKNLFNKKLYVEALRQIRIPFALLFTLIAGGTGFLTITSLISAVYEYKLEKTISFMYVSDILCLIPLTFVVAVPLFTFKLFKFLTKRNASDFYHAIPLKRNCIMFTYVAAILSATVITILVSILIPLIVFSLSQKYISFNFYEVYPFALNVLACALLTMSICILASSMTGTMFTAILFTLAIMFGPRVIIFSITQTISDTLGELITYYYDFGIFNSDVNLIFSEALSFISWEDSNIYSLSLSFAYTTILAIVYLILGFVTFNKRHSEQAENTGKNPFAQHSMRIALGYFFFHIAVTNSYFYYSESDFDIDYIFETCVLVILGIAAMMIFELITTRKAKNLKYCLFSIPAAALLCLVTYMCINVISNNILKFEPNINDLDSIQYITYSNYDDGYDGYFSSYFEKKATEVEITNPEILSLVTDAYSKELAVFKDNFDKPSYYIDLSTLMNKHNTVKIRFNNGFSSEIRYVYFDDTELAKFNALLNTDEKYSSVYHSLPKDFEATHTSPNLLPEELDSIIEALKSEYKSISIDILATCFADGYKTVSEICSINCATVENSKKFFFSINITPELPKTYEAFLEVMNKRTEKADKNLGYMIDLAKNIEDYATETSHGSINLEVYDLEQHKRLCYVSLSSYTKQEIEEGYYEYGYKDFEEFQNDFTNFITNTENSSNSRYIVFASSDCYSEDDDYKSYEAVFYSNDTEFIEKTSNYARYGY